MQKQIQGLKLNENNLSDKIILLTAVSTDMAQWFTTNLQRYYSDDEERLGGVLRDNAVKLFLGNA